MAPPSMYPDEQLLVEIRRVHKANFGVYGRRRPTLSCAAKGSKWPDARSSGSCSLSGCERLPGPKDCAPRSQTVDRILFPTGLMRV
jgi:hypothetical protein